MMLNLIILKILSIHLQISSSSEVTSTLHSDRYILKQPLKPGEFSQLIAEEIRLALEQIETSTDAQHFQGHHSDNYPQSTTVINERKHTIVEHQSCCFNNPGSSSKAIKSQHYDDLYSLDVDDARQTTSYMVSLADDSVQEMNLTVKTSTVISEGLDAHKEQHVKLRGTEFGIVLLVGGITLTIAIIIFGIVHLFKIRNEPS